MKKLFSILVASALISMAAFAVQAPKADIQVAAATVNTIKTEATKMLKVNISNATVNPVAFGTQSTNLYFSITNSTDKDLTIIDVTSDVANSTEIHGGKAGAADKAATIIIPAGKTLDFKPEGPYISLIKVKKELVVDDKITFNINTKELGLQSSTATVKAVN